MPCDDNTWETEGLEVDIDYVSMRALDPLPTCPQCGFVSRPNICMYGDTDEGYVWEESQKNADNFRVWRDENKSKKVVIFEIGVGAEGLKRHLSQYRQEFSDATLIRINTDCDETKNDTQFNLRTGAKDAFINLDEGESI